MLKVFGGTEEFFRELKDHLESQRIFWGELNNFSGVLKIFLAGLKKFLSSKKIF